MKDMEQEFPHLIHVMQRHSSSQDPEDLKAYRAVENAIEGDGPTYVAVYRRERIERYRKVAVQFEGNAANAADAR